MAKKARRPNAGSSKSGNNRQAAQGRTRENGKAPLSVVGIGASAGGLEAFAQLLTALPADTGMAFVVVQHLAPAHDSLLSELLGKATKMPVVVVTQGMTLRPNRVFVIPPNADMSIDAGSLRLARLNADRALRMPIDSFFRSLAENYQHRAVGIVLSGT